MELISREKDWKYVTVQKVVTLIIYCNVACLTFHLPHITTGSFRATNANPQPLLTTPTFGRMQHTFSQMKELCILQDSVVTYFKCGG